MNVACETYNLKSGLASVIGKSEGARVLSYINPNSQGGIDWKINGFCLKDFAKDENKKEYYETLDLFITFYKNEYDYNITKDDWKRIIDVASQTKIFDNLELANVKTIQPGLAKKEKIKEQALIKAYESIKKLKKYKIEI